MTTPKEKSSKTDKREIFRVHEKGKIEIKNKLPIKSSKDLSLIYTPGVAEVSREIFSNKEKVFKYTIKSNSVAIITDGTRVLGLGDIGPEAALPVMEGKAVLFKTLANIDAFPICLNEKDPDKIVEIIKSISPVFGAINLEDIDAPKVFEIKERLEKELDIPVFHDDSDGTGIVAYAGLMNSLKIVGKKPKDIEVVIAGSGSAGYGIARMLYLNGIKKIIMSDSKGLICSERHDIKGTYKEEIMDHTNPRNLCGLLSAAIKGTDVFIGVSGTPNLITEHDIKGMADNPIVFALSNPDPEINPRIAKKSGAAIIATGRSDYPNQINNAQIFPGLMRAILDNRIKEIDQDLKNVAAIALATAIKEKELSKEKILPSVLENNLSTKIASFISKFIKP